MIQPPSLSQLNDIAPPAEASWWPPTWWSIGVVVLVVLVAFSISFWLIRHKLKAKARRQAYKQLQRVTPATTEQVTLLLKRVALAYYPKHSVANLHGKPWLTFLLSAMNSKAEQHFYTELQQYDINSELYGQATSPFCHLYKAIGEHWLQLDLSKMPGEIDV